jgi:hypothetical protein
VTTINKKAAVIPKRVPTICFALSRLSLLRGVQIPKKAIAKGVVNFVEKAKKEASITFCRWSGWLRAKAENNRKIVGTSKLGSMSRMSED